MNIKLNYEERGQGFPLILLHGNGENLTYFKDQIAFFSDEYRVIAVDTRGHGRSPRGIAPFTIRQFADDLREFMEELGIDRAHILGFSDGGNIAAVFAMKYPEKVEKLILNGANLDPSGVKGYFQIPITLAYRLMGARGRDRRTTAGKNASFERSTSAGENASFERSTSAGENGSFERSTSADENGSPERKASAAETMNAAGAASHAGTVAPSGKASHAGTVAPAGKASKKELFGLMVEDPNIKPEELAQIKAPTLVIAGTRDLIKCSHTRLIASCIPDSQLVFIKGGHSLAKTRAAEFNAAVSRFLKGEK
ncbi:MAG: alpha/beta fold hydrolase [Anaerovoracaceae bacterium]